MDEWGPPDQAKHRPSAAGRTPVVALGGVTAERAPELRAAGAAGMACIGAVLNAEDPAAAARDLRSAWDGVR